MFVRYTFVRVKQRNASFSFIIALLIGKVIKVKVILSVKIKKTDAIFNNTNNPLDAKMTVY
jgi:hypothetical protein